LKEAVLPKKKHKKKGKDLGLQQQQKQSRGVQLWSPRKVHEIRAREAACEQDEIEEKLQKACAMPKGLRKQLNEHVKLKLNTNKKL
jgi:hypothetical protein